MIEYQEKEHTMQNMPIAIFRGDDTDALGYQTIVGTIRTDLDLTGCRAVFKYLSFSVEFDPIPEDKKLTVIIPSSETSKFPPGLGYASLRVYDAEGKLCTFSNRIMVFVATKTPMFGNAEFEVDFNVRPELEPLKIFVGPNPDDFDEYRGFLEKVIDRASAEKYGLAILLDAIDSDLGADDGVAATPVAVKAAYAAIIKKLTDDYYTADETDEAIDKLAAYYITYNAAGAAFPTRAALLNATVVYSGGVARTPTRNDYAVVLADETHDGAEWRYIYAVAEGETVGQWEPQYSIETNNYDGLANKPQINGNTLTGNKTGAALGLATTADATLTERGYSEWTCDPATITWRGQSLLVEVRPSGDRWIIYIGSGMFSPEFGNGDTTEYSYTGTGPNGTTTVTATRTALLGYRLGPDEQTNPNRDKPLASEAEAEALRQGKQNALSVQQLANIAAVSDALAFDATHSYAAGDPVVYNGTLYTFTSTHTGAWTGSDVSAVDIIARLAGKLDKSGDTMTGRLTFYNSRLILMPDPLVPSMTVMGAGIVFPRTSGTLALTAGTGHTGNLAALDSNGNPTDSGVKASDKLNSTSAAPAFSSSSTYAVGEHCTYNGALYRCTTAVTTAGAWTGSTNWTADTMTDPDAVLDITSQNQLRVVAKDGTLLWAQGYDLASTSSATLACDATTNFTFVDGATTQAFTLPTAPTGKVGDFGLDIDNSANTGAATMTLTGLDSTFSVVVPEGESLTDMLAIAAGELARFYITLSTFRVNNLPTWHIVKQVVENGGAQS